MKILAAKSTNRKLARQDFCAMDKIFDATYLLPPPGGTVPIFWNGMGEETRRSARYNWHGLKRGDQRNLVWQLTLSGQGWLRIGSEKPVSLTPGTGFIANVPSDHCYY
jgi:hypothetical protein